MRLDYKQTERKSEVEKDDSPCFAKGIRNTVKTYCSALFHKTGKFREKGPQGVILYTYI